MHPFATTLLHFGPSGTYTLNPLSGGLINETVRATCTHASSILKYAPPYIAALGPSKPFGRERQTVEAAALSLFMPWLDGRLAHLGPNADVTIPASLFFDEKNHVICRTDFGASVSLTDYLTSPSVGGVGYEYAGDIGRRMGTFFAKLHSPSVFQLVKASEDGMKIRDNASVGRNVVRNIIVARLEAMMLQFGVTASEAEDLAGAVARNGDEAEQAEPNAATFVLGDSWTGSVLLGIGRAKLEMAVIDWEFASLHPNGVCSDIATMLAHVRLRSIAAADAGHADVVGACEALGREMARSYRRTSLKEGAPWIEQTRDFAGGGGWERLARGICVAIGRDMIHNASDLEWMCTCCGSLSGEKECILRTSMVHDGVGFLRAGINLTLDDLEKFVEGEEVLRLLLGRRDEVAQRLETSTGSVPVD